MIRSLFVLLVAVAGGTTVLWFLGLRRLPLVARICAGAPLGIVLLGMAGLVSASVLGMRPASVALAILAVGSPLAVTFALNRRRHGNAPGARIAFRRNWRRRGARTAQRVLFWVVAVLALSAIFSRVMIESPRGIAVGDDHDLGDLPFHLGIITGFAWGENFPPEHPELAGAKLTYPFLVDLVAAMLVRVGATLRDALLAENLVLALALVGTLYRFGLVVSRRPLAAFLTPVLVLLSGGLGFTRLFTGNRGFPNLLELGRDYTITWTGELRWGNSLVTLFVPQRSLLLGVPLAVFVFTLLWEAQRNDRDDRRLLRAAGVVTGLLPLAHGHAFVVTLGVAAILLLLFPARQRWLNFFVPALVLAAPQVLWLIHGSAMKAGAFLGWELGWDRGGRPLVWFWLDNTGLLLPLLLTALALERWRRRLVFSVPFLLLLLVPNLLRLSPWIWDNIKFLFFWFVGSIPLVAGLLARWARRGWGKRLLVAGLSAGLTLSGALDVWRMASRQIEHLLFDESGMAFAQQIIAKTPPRALILHAPTYNSPVYLTGRRSLVGYLGHIFSQGFDSGGREQDLGRIYSGHPNASTLLARHGIDYLLVGPQERREFAINAAFLRDVPVAVEQGSYRLYAVSSR